MSVDAILSRAIDGCRVTGDEAVELIESASLPVLAWAANAICSAKHPEGYRTYAIDRNINYTNICASGCRFCAFYRAPGDPDGYVLSTDQILRKIDEAASQGATHILMQGGLHPDLRIEWFESLFGEIKSAFPEIGLHSLSAPEIAHISRVSGRTVRTTLERLIKAGLCSLPGGGAEILVDSVRSRVSPRKCATEEWLEVMRTAAELGLRATATMLIGLGESACDRVEHLQRLRALQDETNVFTAFIPWTFQPGNTDLGGHRVGAHEYLKTLAVSRTFLDNIDNIQASWVTQGRAIAQLALRFGANDVGSTMIEENVVAATGVSLAMSEHDLITLLHEAGFDAVQRDSAYRIVRTHPREEARKD